MRIPDARSAGIALALQSIIFLLCAAPAPAQEPPNAPNGVVAISASLCSEMKTRHVLNPGGPVDCDRLKLVKFTYLGFDEKSHLDGAIVVMDAAADHVLQIFKTLYQRHFPIQRAALMNAYHGDDDASMDDNNTSSFNVRPVAGGNSISLHAYGLAIDLNPLQNPFLQRSGPQAGSISPRAGAPYVDRSNVRPGMVEAVVDVFADHGFLIWGGEWKDPTDYQHFQVSRRFAEALARSSAQEAKAMFERNVTHYRACMSNAAAKRRRCAQDVR